LATARRTIVALRLPQPWQSAHGSARFGRCAITARRCHEIPCKLQRRRMCQRANCAVTPPFDARKIFRYAMFDGHTVCE
jgi:hypothetical protein